MLKDVIRTALDLAGLLLIAAGLAFAAALLIGPAALAVGGLVLIAGARLTEWIERPDAMPKWVRRLTRRDT